ncbi:Lipase [Balamuthia mandrillaris]
MQHDTLAPSHCLEDVFGCGEETNTVFSISETVQLAAKVWGVDKGYNRVLCLHGWMDNSATWSTLAPLLKKDGLYLVCLDLLGHGLSSHASAAVAYTAVNYIPDIMAVVDQLGWDKFSILGHSLGAIITTFITAIFPQRVKRCVLVEGLAPRTTTSALVLEVLRDAVMQNKTLLGKKPKIYPSLTHAIRARHGGPDAVFPVSEQSARLLVLRGAKFVTSHDSDEVKRDEIQFIHDPSLRSSSLQRFTPEQIKVFLNHIECPVLLLVAEKGIPAWTENNPKEKAQFKEYTQCIKHLTEVFIPGQAHHVHVDAPETVYPHVSPFLLAGCDEQQTTARL